MANTRRWLANGWQLPDKASPVEELLASTIILSGPAVNCDRRGPDKVLSSPNDPDVAQYERHDVRNKE